MRKKVELANYFAVRKAEDAPEAMGETIMVDPQSLDPNTWMYFRHMGLREVIINEEITDKHLDVAMNILMWNQDDAEIPVKDRIPIRIYINTNGGDLDPALQIADMISLSQTPVITIGIRALSAGFLILMAGHKRYIFPHSYGLLHDGSAATAGNLAKVFDTMEYLVNAEDRAKAFILGKTKISEEEYDSNYRRDWYFFGEELLEYGVADEVITDIGMIL